MLTSSGKSRGFSLIEMMIAIVTGIVVVGAVLTFIVSTIQANGQTVRSTRLNQELRSTMELIARDIRRSRSLSDPISRVGSACTSTSTCNITSVTVSASCMLYAYQGAAGGDFRMVRRATSGSVGHIQISAGAAAQTCATAGTNITSPSVDITDFTATLVGNDRVDLVLQGKLVGDTSGVTQTYRTTVYIRSGGVS